MDYSLLVGIHFRDISEGGDLIPSESCNPSGSLIVHFNLNVCNFYTLLN